MAAAQNYAAGLQAHGLTSTWIKGQTVGSGTSFMPYQANVVWQDTTSNATYCSAGSVLGG